tara:strand:- start:1563 stop:2906 length:1344 start_codon:yes stop_codon:yes gene_type:complete
MEEFKEYIFECKNFNEIYDIRWKLHLGEKVQKKHYKNIKLGLINVPCGGYGDVIKCIKIYEYIKRWYPGIDVTILSASQEKFRNLGIKNEIIDIKHKNNKKSECAKFKDLKIVGNKKFNCFLIIPVISDPFDINDFKKMIPYATNWNTFTMSEYNDIDTVPTDFPIGVGNKNLGLFFDKPVLEKQKFIKNPYALVYIQSKIDNIFHSRYCFLSFLEMIINKDKYKNHKKFEIVLPKWISEDILFYRPVKYKFLKITKKQYQKITVITKEEEKILFNIKENNDKKRINRRSKKTKKIKKINKELIIRGDILPQPREKFIGLIKDSIKDILLTGDESLVDTLNCSPNKTIWYQIAPWKQNLAENLSIETGNKNYKNFRTSCGNIKGYKFKNDTQKLIKENDFRKKGHERFDSAIIGFYENHNNKDIQKIIDIIEHSRYLDTLKKKIKNM